MAIVLVDSPMLSGPLQLRASALVIMKPSCLTLLGSGTSLRSDQAQTYGARVCWDRALAQVGPVSSALTVKYSMETVAASRPQTELALVSLSKRMGLICSLIRRMVNLL